jgi:hypothetical protein
MAAALAVLSCLLANAGADADPPDPDVPPGPAESSPKPSDSNYDYRYTVPPPPSQLGRREAYAPGFGDPSRNFEDELTKALSLGEESASLLTADWNQNPEDLLTSGELVINAEAGRIESAGPVRFELGDVDIRSDSFVYTFEDRRLLLKGNVLVQRGDSRLSADSLRFDNPPIDLGDKLVPILPTRGGRAAGHPLIPHGTSPEDYAPGSSRGSLHAENVVWEEQGLRELRGDSIDIDLDEQTGTMLNAEGRAGPLYFGAQQLHVQGPGNALAMDLWVTTCDRPVPHYRLRLTRAELEDNSRVVGMNARLQLGRVNTPLYFPRVVASLLPEERLLATELKFGGSARIGSYINVAQWFRATENANLAPRFYPTTSEGIGFGLDGEYDLTNSPAATFFRSSGEFETLYTTEDRGYVHWYHRQELTPDTVALVQWEEWSDAEFIKDFYNSEYENRTGPRSFVNLTRTRPGYIATATVAPSLNGFTTETQKYPELTFHLLERNIGRNWYGTFDSTSGLYATRPDSLESVRTLAVGRMSYDWNVAPGFNVLPFVEVDGTHYSRTPDDRSDAVRGSMVGGVTVQSRIQRGFRGVRKFSGFKHLIIPSTSVLYRPAATIDADETPRFDDLDDRPARFRVESTLDNILLGRNAATGEVWSVARVTLYHGNDVYNESGVSSDYEAEVEVRPRPWWGVQAIGELHTVEEGPGSPGEDFNRVLAHVFFDNAIGKNNLNARIGYAHTDAAGEILNREILYGAGYKLNRNWSIGFEQRFDIDRTELSRQTYAIRRRLHDWEVGLTVRKRESGVDVGFQIGLLGFSDVGLGR